MGLAALCWRKFSAFFSDVWWTMTMKWETEPHSTWMFWSKSRKPSMLATSWTVIQKVLKTRLHLSWFNTRQRDGVICSLRGLFLLSPGLTVSNPLIWNLFLWQQLLSSSKEQVRISLLCADLNCWQFPSRSSPWSALALLGIAEIHPLQILWDYIFCKDKGQQILLLPL